MYSGLNELLEAIRADVEDPSSSGGAHYKNHLKREICRRLSVLGRLAKSNAREGGVHDDRAEFDAVKRHAVQTMERMHEEGERALRQHLHRSEHDSDTLVQAYIGACDEFANVTVPGEFDNYVTRLTGEQFSYWSKTLRSQAQDSLTFDKYRNSIKHLAAAVVRAAANRRGVC